MAGHSVMRLVLIGVMCLVYVVLLVLAYFSSSPVGNDLGLFVNNTGDVSDVFELTITPASWTFSIWGFIFAWQLIWMIYTLTTICRRVGDEDRYVYQLPVTPDLFYVVFIINNCFVIAWLFLWDRQLMGWALLDIVFTPLTLYICLAISFVRLYQSQERLRQLNLAKDIWLTRFLIQNGLAFFATWVTIATLLNFAIVLTYIWGLTEATASLIALIVLSVAIALWFLLETFAIDKYVRYTFSPYIVLNLALAGSLSKNLDLEENRRNSIFLLALLAVTAVLSLVKLFLMFWRHFRYPIRGNAGDDHKGRLA